MLHPRCHVWSRDPPWVHVRSTAREKVLARFHDRRLVMAVNDPPWFSSTKSPMTSA
jgi:hypothetical protein